MAGVPLLNVQFDVAIGSLGDAGLDVFVKGVAAPTHTGGVVKDGIGGPLTVTGKVTVCWQPA